MGDVGEGRDEFLVEVAKPKDCMDLTLASETTKGFDPLKGLAVIAYFER